MPDRIVLGSETQRWRPFGDSSLILLVPWNYFRWYIRWNFHVGASELIPFGARLDCLWDLQSLEIPSRGFLFAFAGASELLPFGARSNLRWNFPAGALELIPFGSRSDHLWYLQSPEIHSRGFLSVFPCWGLLWLLVRGEVHFPPLGVSDSSRFLGNSINHQMTDCLRSPRPSRWLHTYVRPKY